MCLIHLIHHSLTIVVSNNGHCICVYSYDFIRLNMTDIFTSIFFFYFFF